MNLAFSIRTSDLDLDFTTPQYGSCTPTSRVESSWCAVLIALLTRWTVTSVWGNRATYHLFGSSPRSNNSREDPARRAHSAITTTLDHDHDPLDVLCAAACLCSTDQPLLIARRNDPFQPDLDPRGLPPALPLVLLRLCYRSNCDRNLYPTHRLLFASPHRIRSERRITDRDPGSWLLVTPAVLRAANMDQYSTNRS